MKILKSTNGWPFAISDQHFEFVTQWNWFVYVRDGKPHSVQRVENGSTIKLSRELMRLEGYNVSSDEVDHKDRNPLNNLIENLRVSTSSQNNANRSIHRNNSTGYKGINFRKDLRKFQAQIMVRGQKKHLGYFVTPELAAKAYDREAKACFGEFAVLNFTD